MIQLEVKIPEIDIQKLDDRTARKENYKESYFKTKIDIYRKLKNIEIKQLQEDLDK